ncbi:hypothetical protein DM860_016925 [Cuscuta australis]|uniref:Uncharacterized protein n=1 Tax=Cuscuta australis TaxID=267555 RepID=A0A328E103_9ASTE|nr:hypothetical protein DM860_016925 [Cuscuta australis]
MAVGVGREREKLTTPFAFHSLAAAPGKVLRLFTHRFKPFRVFDFCNLALESAIPVLRSTPAGICNFCVSSSD